MGGIVIGVGRHVVGQIRVEIPLVVVHGNVGQGIAVGIGIGRPVIAIIVCDGAGLGSTAIIVSIGDHDGKGLLAFTAVFGGVPGGIIARASGQRFIIVLVKVATPGVQGPPQRGAPLKPKVV